MARLHPDPYPIPEPDWSDYKPWPPGTEPQNADDIVFDQLMKTSDNLPPGQYVGLMMGWGRGDGTAWYLVVKEKPFTLQHVPYADAWTVEYALIRGLTLADAKAHRDWKAQWRNLSKKEN